MPVDFPGSPTSGQVFSVGGSSWRYNGYAWARIPDPGEKGQKGQKGEVGEKGQKGQTGDKGVQGNFGGATFDYTFSASTGTPTDLNTGRLRLNNSSVSSATVIFIDDEDDNGTDIQPFLRTIDDSTSTIKGHVRISNKLNADDFALFTISSTTEQSGFHQISVGYVSGSATSFTNGEDITVTFARTGDQGQKGEQGIQGIQGVQDKIFEGDTEAEVVDTGGNGHFKVTTEGTERFKIDNVGLATFTNDVVISNNLFLNKTVNEICKIDHDGANLDLHSDGNVRFFESDNDKLMFTFDVNTIYDDARLIMEGDDDTFFNHPDNNQLGFTAGGTETIRIKAGKVGIKNNSPTTALDVTGSIRAFFDANNNILLNPDDGSIELKRSNGAFIDFATAGTEDHDCRIKQEDNGLAFTTGGNGSATEKFRFGSSGQLGLAGANYGTSGQVLTSQGGSSSPSWTSLPASVTYDLITSSVGANVQLLLDASVGDDDPILITAGTNVSFASVSATGFTINTVDTTYDLVTANGDNANEEKIQLNGSDSTTDTVTLAVSTGLSIARDTTTGKITLTNTDTGSGSNTFIGLTDTPSSFTANKTLKVNSSGNAVIFADDNDTKYDLITSSSGSNVILTLDASVGDDDPILITAGSNITLTENGSGTGFTIASTDTNTQVTINNNADNRIITGSNTANTLNAESNLTFDGSVFKINGTGQALLTLRTTDNTSDRGIAFQNSGNAYVASINVEDAGSSYGDLVFHVDDTNNTDLSLVEERLRIRRTGALGLNGSNYGSSGQVLTSQGSNSAPTWNTLPSGVTTFLQLNDTPSSFTANKTLKVNSSGNAVIFTDDINTTYDLVTSTSGSNIKLKLDASTGSGDDDEITITAGTNVTLTDNSGGGFTIDTSSTLTGTIDESNATKITTASNNEYHNITFVPIATTNDSYQTLEIDSQDNVLAYNPSLNRIKTTGIQLSRVYTSGGSAGSSGQLLTSGGNSGNFTWTAADSVGTDNYANSLSFSSGTLTLGRTGSLSDLTTTIPLSGITGGFKDLDDTPNDYNGDANKLVAVNNGNGTNGTGLTFVNPSSVGTDTFVTSASFASITGGARLTIGRNNGQSNVTADLTVTTLGVENFTDLSDTPNSLSGQGSKVVRVNTAGNALEFVTSSSVGTDTNTTYSISCVNGINSDEERIRLTAGGSGSGTDDITLEAGTGLSISRSGDKITFTNNDTGSGANTTYDLSVPSGTTKLRLAGSNSTNDDVEIAGGTNVTVTRNNGNKLTISSTDTNTNTTYSAGSDYGMALSGTEFRLKDDRRRNSTTTDVRSGNTHDYTFYDASHGIRWYTSGNEEMRLENDGDLHVDGDIIAFSTTVSDIRLKKDLQIIQNPLDIINKINGYTFTYKKDDKKSAGVVAQEVEKVFPQAVSEKSLPFSSEDEENPDNYKTVEYDQIVGLLVQAVKELSDKVKKLEGR